MIEDNTITNTTAKPIPLAVSVFFDTPKNEHIPKNLANNTLLTSNALKNILKSPKFIHLSIAYLTALAFFSLDILI